MTSHQRSQSTSQKLAAAIFGDRLIPSPIKFIVAFGVCAALTFVLLSDDPWSIFKWVPVRPKTDLPDRIPDKVYHFTGYFSLSLVLMWYAAARSRWVAIALVCFAFAHAGMTEILQGYVPDRMTDWKDFVANSLGITIGTAIGLLGRRVVQRDDPEPVLWANAANRSNLAEDFDPRDSIGTKRVPTALRQQSSEKPLSSQGLKRDQSADSLLRNWKTRILNYRFLGMSCVIAAVCGGSTLGLHAWQVQRNSGTLLTLGKAAREAGDLQKAKGFYSQYVALRPNDQHAFSDYGVLIDLTRKGKRGIGQVFNIYEEVLRVDPTRDDIRRRQVKVTMEMARYTDSLAHLKVLRQSRPDDGELDTLAGQCLEELGEFEAAAEAYQMAIDHSPELIDAHRRLALLNHLKLDRREVATKLLDQLVLQNEKVAAAWIARAKFRQDIGLLEAAVEDIERAIKLQPENPDVLNAASDLAYARIVRARTEGRSAAVERIVLESKTQLTAGLKAHPDNIELKLQMIVLESHFGDHAAAWDQLEAVIVAHPQEMRAHALLADLAIERGDFDRARKTLDLLPRTPQADALRLFLAGRIGISQKKWEDALLSLSEARRYLADEPQMLERVDLALARCHESLKHPESELDAYRRLLKSNPTSLIGRLGLAASLVKVDRVPEAIAEYRQLAHMPQVRLALARLLIIQNLRLSDLDRDWRDIEVLLDDARQTNDDPVQESLLRAELLAGKGLFDDARLLLERAKAEHGDRVEFLVALSRLAEHSGDQRQAALWLSQAFDTVGQSEQAEVILRKAVELSAAENPSKLTLIQFLLRQRREAEALKLFEEIGSKLSRLELAKTYALFGDLGRSVSIYQKELADRPESLDALQGLADLYLKNGLTARAEPLLRKILARPAQFPPSAVQAARRQLAVIVAGKADFRASEEALSLLDANTKDGRGSTEEQRARAAVLAMRRTDTDRAAAIQILERLDDQGLLLQKDRWLLGRLYDETGNAPQATVQFERVIKSASDRGTYVREYISYQLDAGQIGSAEKWLQRLSEIAPRDAQTVQLTARVYARKGQFKDALRTLDEFVAAAKSSDLKITHLNMSVSTSEQLAKENTANEAARAELLAASEKYQRAAVAADGTQVSALIAWLIRQSRSEESVQELDRLWKQLPAEAAAGVSMALLGELPHGSPHVAKVEARIQSALATAPKSLALKVCMADIRSLQGKFEEAETIYRAVLEADRENLPALNNLAWHLAMRGQHLDEALTLIDRALSIAGPVAQLLDTRGCVYLAMSNSRRATQDLNAAVVDTPTATTWLHLAAAQLQAGEAKAASTSLKAAKKIGLSTSKLHPLERQLLDTTEAGIAKAE